MNKSFSKDDAKYLIKNFFLIFRKYLIFLEKLFITKLESTINKIENFFSNALDKKIYRIPGYLIIFL